MGKGYYLAIEQIIRTGHWITDQVSVVLKKFDITEPQFNVLRILKGQNGSPVTVQDIQIKMVQKSSNVSRIIDKLFTKSLITREECPSNRRKVDIRITQKGEKLLKELNKEVENFHQPMSKNLTETEVETLKELIIKLKGN
ncbi:MarR family winged helix-turn-helix transcriptional regulator [Sediminitomix flava]|nr:MarR family transcriptional regulator [Sediminitomix flava]